MARAQNPFGPDLGSDIGFNLGRALFGDPAAALTQANQQSEMAQREAEAEAARARARLAASQATGEDIKNTSNTGLPALFANLYKTQAAIPAAPQTGIYQPADDEIAVTPATAAVPGVTADQAFKSGLPALIAGMAQSGHGSNIGEAVRAMGAFGGGDEMARRALVAGGASPTASFAITPQRADQIAADDATAKLHQALGVATINNRDDIPVANIQAGSAANVANIAAGSRATVADIKTQGGRYTGGWTPRASNGGDNSDDAVDSKIAGASQFLGVQPGDDLSHVSALKIAQAMTLSEGGPGSLAARNNNPANIKTADGKGFMVYPTPQAGLAAATALVQRKLANGQTTVQSMIEGKPPKSGGGLSDAAVDQAAQAYNMTGKLPTGLGRGGAAQQQILSRAAAIAQGSVGDRQASQAGRAGDVKSLANLQKQTDAMIAFERTTVVNGNAAIQQAIKNGGASTVAAWNRWVQSGKKAFADPGVRALDVAVSTLASEYGKAIGGGANGSAALTDSARREAQGYFSSAMTPAELSSAVGQAKIDMRNRRVSYQQQLSDIRGRISGGGSPASAPSGDARRPPSGATKTATGPNNTKLALVSGKWVSY